MRNEACVVEGPPIHYGEDFELTTLQCNIRNSFNIHEVYDKLVQGKLYGAINYFQILPVPYSFTEQRGYNCQLYALGNALHRLYHKQLIPKPLPIRKAEVPESKESLRQQYKGLGSVVGEPIGLDRLQQWVDAMPGVEATTTYCRTEEDYVTLLKHAIDANLTPIVHFDMVVKCFFDDDGKPRSSESSGQPAEQSWVNLHGAMVLGYVVDANHKLFFLVTSDGRMFNLTDGHNLYRSAAQPFNPDKIPVEYKKILGRKTPESHWLSTFYPLLFSYSDWRKPTDNKVRLKQADLATCTGGAVFIVDARSKREELVRELQRVIDVNNEKTALLKNYNPQLIVLRDKLTRVPHRPFFKIIAEWKADLVRESISYRECIAERSTPGCGFFKCVSSPNSRLHVLIETGLDEVTTAQSSVRGQLKYYRHKFCG